MNLNQVTVPALDIDTSIAFYRKLGLKLIVRSPHYARFECPNGPATFSIHRVDKTGGSSNTVIYFEVLSLDDAVRRLQREGMTFLSEPRTEPWLWREARVEDPAGNVICLYFAGENRLHPPWRIDP